jgi:hypothetical protein
MAILDTGNRGYFIPNLAKDSTALVIFNELRSALDCYREPSPKAMRSISHHCPRLCFRAPDSHPSDLLILHSHYVKLHYLSSVEPGKRLESVLRPWYLAYESSPSIGTG